VGCLAVVVVARFLAVVSERSWARQLDKARVCRVGWKAVAQNRWRMQKGSYTRRSQGARGVNSSYVMAPVHAALLDHADLKKQGPVVKVGVRSREECETCRCVGRRPRRCPARLTKSASRTAGWARRGIALSPLNVRGRSEESQSGAVRKLLVFRDHPNSGASVIPSAAPPEPDCRTLQAYTHSRHCTPYLLVSKIDCSCWDSKP
jgi:hypothetical protein